MGTGVTLAVRPPGKSGSWRLDARGWKKPSLESRSFAILKSKLECRISMRTEGSGKPQIPPENSVMWKGPDSPNADALGKFYGQAERPISTGKLHALLRFHPPPIKVVVFDWPS